MKRSNYISAATPSLPMPVRPAGSWLPVYVQPVAPLDVSYWQSRAARGFSWNATALTRKVLM